MQSLIQNNSVCGHFSLCTICTRPEMFVCPFCSANDLRWLCRPALIKEDSFCLSGFFTWFLVQQPLLQILERSHPFSTRRWISRREYCTEYSRPRELSWWRLHRGPRWLCLPGRSAVVWLWCKRCCSHFSVSVSKFLCCKETSCTVKLPVAL